MREIKTFFLVLLCPCIVVSLCRSGFAQQDGARTDDHIELIPLNASYDTNYKFGTASSVTSSALMDPLSTNPLSINPLEVDTTAVHNNQPLLNVISLRKIIPVIFESGINSKSVFIGDLITARLKEDLYYGRQLIAGKNSLLKGRVISYRGARTLSNSICQAEDRLKSSSAIGIQFNELVIDKGKSIALTGLPVHQESFWRGADGYNYGISVDHQGRIVEAGRTLSKEQKDSYNVLRVATNVPVPGGFLLNLATAPAVMGAVGAASPDLAFSKPLDHNVKHKRLKGMAYGFVTNLPGAFLVQAVVQKGNEVVLSSGDELMIDLGINQASISSESLDVKGQILEQAVFKKGDSEAQRGEEPCGAERGHARRAEQSEGEAAHMKARLLPASSTSHMNRPAELALKPFIPISE